MGLQDRDWFREETRRRREATRGSQHSRIARPSYRQPTAGSGGSRFKLFVMACLIIGPLWMWAYHENVPISVTAWQAASAAYDSLASFSKEAASDASTVISEEIRSTPHAQEALGETNSQKYAGGSPLNRGEEEIRSTPDAQEEIRSTPGRTRRRQHQLPTIAWQASRGGGNQRRRLATRPLHPRRAGGIGKPPQSRGGGNQIHPRRAGGIGRNKLAEIRGRKPPQSRGDKTMGDRVHQRGENQCWPTTAPSRRRHFGHSTVAQREHGQARSHES